MKLAALKQYLPVFGLAVVALLQALYASLDDNAINGQEFLTVAAAFLAALLTYVVPRLPGQLQWLKTAITAVLAVVTTLTLLVPDGVSAQDVVTIVLAALGALGVAVTTKYVPVTEPVRDDVVPGPVVNTTVNNYGSNATT